jgi:hypothetical protein
MDHLHRALGRAHAELAHRRRRLGDRGQGTVEYVALMLLVAAVLSAVVVAARGFNGDNGIATLIVEKVKGAIGEVDKSKG